MIDICGEYLAQHAEYSKDKGPAFNMLVQKMKARGNTPLYSKNNIVKSYHAAAKDLIDAKGLDVDYDEPDLTKKIRSELDKTMAPQTPPNMKDEMNDAIEKSSKYLSHKAIYDAQRGDAYDLLIKRLEMTGNRNFTPQYKGLETNYLAAHALKTASTLDVPNADPALASEFKKALEDCVLVDTPPEMVEEMREVIRMSSNYLSVYIRDRGEAMQILLNHMKDKGNEELVRRAKYSMTYGKAAQEVEEAPGIVPYLPVKDISDEVQAKLTEGLKGKTPERLDHATKALVKDVAGHLSQPVALRSGVAGERYPINYLANINESLGERVLFQHKNYTETYRGAAKELKAAGQLGSSKNQDLVQKINQEMNQGVRTRVGPEIHTDLGATMTQASKHLADIEEAKGEALEHLIAEMENKGDERLARLQGYNQTYKESAKRLKSSESLHTSRVDQAAYKEVSSKLNNLMKKKPPAGKAATVIGEVVDDASKFLASPIPETKAEKRKVLARLMDHKDPQVLAQEGHYKMTYGEGGQKFKEAPYDINPVSLDTAKQKEITRDVKSVIPQENKSLLQVLSETAHEAGSHLTDVVKGRKQAMDVIHTGLKEGGKKDLVKVGKYNATFADGAKLVEDAPHFKKDKVAPGIYNEVEQKMKDLPKTKATPLAEKHLKSTTQIASKFIAGEATEKSGLSAKQLGLPEHYDKTLDGQQTEFGKTADGAIGGVDGYGAGVPGSPGVSQAGPGSGVSGSVSGSGVAGGPGGGVGGPGSGPGFASGPGGGVGGPGSGPGVTSGPGGGVGGPDSGHGVAGGPEGGVGRPGSGSGVADGPGGGVGGPGSGPGVAGGPEGGVGGPGSVSGDAGGTGGGVGGPGSEPGVGRPGSAPSVSSGPGVEGPGSAPIGVNESGVTGGPEVTGGPGSDRLKPHSSPKVSSGTGVGKPGSAPTVAGGTGKEVDGPGSGGSKSGVHGGPGGQAGRPGGSTSGLGSGVGGGTGGPGAGAGGGTDKDDGDIDGPGGQRKRGRGEEQGGGKGGRDQGRSDDDRDHGPLRPGGRDQKSPKRRREEVGGLNKYGIDNVRTRFDKKCADRELDVGGAEDLESSSDEEPVDPNACPCAVAADRVKRRHARKQRRKEIMQQNKKSALKLLRQELAAKGDAPFYSAVRPLTHKQASDWLGTSMRVEPSVKTSRDVTRLQAKFEQKMVDVMNNKCPENMEDAMQDSIIESSRKLAENYVTKHYEKAAKNAFISEMQKKGNTLLTDDGETYFYAAQRLKKSDDLYEPEPCEQTSPYLQQELDNTIRGRSIPRKMVGTMKEYSKTLADYLSTRVGQPDKEITAYCTLLDEMEAEDDKDLVNKKMKVSYKEATNHLRQRVSNDDVIINKDKEREVYNEINQNLTALVSTSDALKECDQTEVTNTKTQTTNVLTSYVSTQVDNTEALNSIIKAMEYQGDTVLLRHGPVVRTFQDGADKLKNKNSAQIHEYISKSSPPDPVVVRKINVRIENISNEALTIKPEVTKDVTTYLAKWFTEPHVTRTCCCRKSVPVQCELWCDESLRRVVRSCCGCPRCSPARPPCPSAPLPADPCPALTLHAAITYDRASPLPPPTRDDSAAFSPDTFVDSFHTLVTSDRTSMASINQGDSESSQPTFISALSAAITCCEKVSTTEMSDWNAMLVSLMWNMQAWRHWIHEQMNRLQTPDDLPSWSSYEKRVTLEALQWRQYNTFSKQLAMKLSYRYRNKQIVSPNRETNKTKEYLACQSEMIDMIGMFKKWTHWLSLVVNETKNMEVPETTSINTLNNLRWHYFFNKLQDRAEDWKKYDSYFEECWKENTLKKIPGWVPAWNERAVWVVSACGAVPSGAVPCGARRGHPAWLARTTHRCQVLPAALLPSKHCCILYADEKVFQYSKYQVLCNADVDWIPWHSGSVSSSAVLIGTKSYAGRVIYKDSHLLGPVLPPHYRCHVILMGRPFAFNSYQLLVFTDVLTKPTYT